MSGFFALALGLWASLVPEVATRALGGRDGALQGEGVRAVTAYLLKEDEWAVFRLPQKGGTLKIVLTANVPAECLENTGFGASFGFVQEVLGDDDVVLREQKHVIRASPASSGRVSPGRTWFCEYYLDSSVRPLGSRTVHVNPEGLPEAAEKLRLKLSWAENVIKDVCVRVYCKEAPPPHKLRYLWQRLSRERQERLGRSNLYGTELLTESERRNLLENRWVAIGPQGISGRDYWERKLYSFEVPASSSGVDVGLPAGLFIEAESLGVVPVPEGGGCVRLEWDICEAGPIDADALLTWYGPGTNERFDAVFPVKTGSSSVHQDFGAGLLEIFAPEKIVLRAFLEGAGEHAEITPTPEYVPGYRLSTSRFVEFSNGGAMESVTPFRFDVRRVLDGDDERTPRERAVYYTLVSEDGEIIQAGHLPHQQPISLHDCVVAGLYGQRISEPARTFFALPIHCAFIRFWGSEEDLVITPYTRPGALPRLVSVPEEYRTSARRDDEFRDWFLVRPQNYVQCLREMGEVYVRVQPRPRHVAKEIWEGDYHVVSHEPEGQVSGYKIVTPVGEKLPARERYSPAHFQKLETDTPHWLEFIGRPGDVQVRPRVILFKEGRDPCWVEVLVDGESRHAGALASRGGEVELEPVGIGEHQVEIKSEEPLLFFMNSVRASSDERHVERLVWFVGKEGLTFHVKKRGEEEIALWFRVYQKAYPDSGPEIRVTARDARRKLGVPLDSWTFTSARYNVSPGRGEAIPVLGNDQMFLCGGESLYFKVGSDLGGEEVDVRLEVSDGPECFVQAGHLVPGLREVIQPGFENQQ